jgi:hypothetical protein
MADLAADNLITFLQGGRALNPLNHPVKLRRGLA